MTETTKRNDAGVGMFCIHQLITCNRVKECNGVCPFEDALKHADKEMTDQAVIDHDRDWIIGCIEHDGFIHTHRFDKANRIILEALQTDVVRCKDCRYFKKIVERSDSGLCHRDIVASAWKENGYCSRGERKGGDSNAD